MAKAGRIVKAYIGVKSGNSTTYTWLTSKARVAVVDGNGLVTALQKGTAKITVRTANKKKATVKIKVIN